MRERFRRKLFQFHEGPIKTYCCLCHHVRQTLFQFHEGPIKTEGPTPPTEATRFQFHEGPIKTPMSFQTLVLSSYVSIP